MQSIIAQHTVKTQSQIKITTRKTIKQKKNSFKIDTTTVICCGRMWTSIKCQNRYAFQNEWGVI